MTGWAVLDALGMGIAVLLLAWTLLLFVPFRWRPVGLYLFVPKMAAGAFTPFIAAAGLLLALVGGLGGWWWLAAPAALAAVGAAIVIVRLGRVRADLTAALGPDWAGRIPTQRRARMVARWWRGRLPTVPEPRLRQDVAFATVPGTGRQLLCDLWQPPADVPASGLAVVYLHGGAWYGLDKDVGTRPLFRHLAAQGHVVVDVAYRLFPETDLPGMVADAKRALAWVQHARGRPPDPARPDRGGRRVGRRASGPAGRLHPPRPGPDPGRAGRLRPERLRGRLAVRAGRPGRPLRPHQPAEGLPARRPSTRLGRPPPPWMGRLFGPDAGRLKVQSMVAGRLDWLVGGTPSQVPDRYAWLSPVHHVHPGCPPTLLVHGRHDEMAPVAAMRQLHERLERAGVPVTGVYLPHTDHAFDLLASAWSPQARTAIHVLERFLAVLAATDQRPRTPSGNHPQARSAISTP